MCRSFEGGACVDLLLEEVLDPGEHHQVCVAGETVSYLEWDAGENVFRGPIQARCDGGDVEL